MGWMVYKLAEQLIPRMNGRSCNHFRMCGSLPSTVRVFQQALTVESNSWTTLLVLRLPCSGNFLARYCWNGSMLTVSSSFILARLYNCTREGDWLISDHWPLSAKPSSTGAGPLSNCAGQLIDPLSDSVRPWRGLNRADRFIIRLNG